ncbi:MAG: hypothetical protein ACLTMP_12545 [Eggerthella lenta]
MALGLWVGGLVAGFVFKPLNSRLIMSGANPVTVAFSNYLPVAFFSLIQATLLMVVLQFGLQLQIDNVPAFYAMGYLTALVFAAIMQMLWRSGSPVSSSPSSCFAAADGLRGHVPHPDDARLLWVINRTP